MFRLIAVVSMLALIALSMLATCFLPPISNSPFTLQASGFNLPSAWGIDACLSVHASKRDLGAWLKLLSPAKLKYLRERGAGWGGNASDSFPILASAGYRLVGFADTPGLKPSDSWHQLPEDLLAVYWASTKLSQRFHDIVSVWELPNEPDTMFCRDLPDRLAAYSKAAYLGLRDGGVERKDETRDLKREEEAELQVSSFKFQVSRFSIPPSPPHGPAVLMSALGLFPGPWLRRAAENGLYDYTDGLNVHFYGHARDFRDALRAQVAFARPWTTGRELPVWVTEAGIESTAHDNLWEPHGREIQRQFTLETAQVAWEEKVAVFMPFVLTWAKEEWFALAHSPVAPYPAWTAYAEFTRNHPLPPQDAIAPPRDPSRVVIQWMPDNDTCLPHKVSGSYWFRGPPGKPAMMKGRAIVYNFSSTKISGDFRIKVGPAVRLKAANPEHLEIPAFGKVEVPLSLEWRGRKYGREDVRFRFVTANPRWKPSVAAISVETSPAKDLLPRVHPIEAVQPEAIHWIWEPEPFEVLQRGGVWLGVNGVRMPRSEGASAEGSLTRASVFHVEKANVNPRLPPMAITHVNGLPAVRDGFLRVRFPQGARLEGAVRVDLIDDQGQRFATGENFGRNYFRSDPGETWLAYADFQIYAWGRCLDPTFRPERVREIQLRFFPNRKNARFRIALEVRSP